MISRRWIEEFVDLQSRDPGEIGAALSSLGLEVEETRHVEAPFSGVIVSRVLGIRPHPQADKIRLVRVDTGSAEQEVVCGAWNFNEGALVPLATVGARLAGGLEVGERKIRGVLSRGMLCSETELGLGDDGGGILVLDEGFRVGDDFATALPFPDVLYELKITPNRPDAMSVYGVARDLAAYFATPLRRPMDDVGRTGPETSVQARVEDPERCPRLTVREIRHLRVGQSPLWLRLRLRQAGVRPISNVVDVTNYVMLEYGQPIHAFDLALVPEETLVVRRAEEGERLTTLDGVTRPLRADDLVVACPTGALALAGIMGGESSEVRPDTHRVLLEVAHFAAPGVLLSGKRHGLRSEAGARFERGVDPALPPIASARAARLMADLADGEVAGGFIDIYPRPIQPWVVDLPRHESARLLGVELGADTITDLLQRLGFGVDGEDPFRVTVPTFRPDVTRPVDLVEEIARLHGYDRFPSRLPKGVGEGLPPWERQRRLIRNTLAGAGYHEILTLSFQGPGEIDALGLAVDDSRRQMVRVRNPLSEEQAFLRTSLLPGVLEALRGNQARGRPDVAVFEMGRVFFPSDGELPDQPRRLVFAAVGRLPGVPRWEGDAPERDGRDAVGLGETLAAALGLDFRVEVADRPPFHPGRCGRVVLGGLEVGLVGELHPAVAGRIGLSGRVALGDLDLEALLEPRLPRQFRAPSPYPPVIFDLAFDLAQEVSSAALVEAVKEAAGPGLEKVEVFDLYSGPPLDEGRKSIAVRLTFRHSGRTLTDEEFTPVRRAIVAGVGEQLGGRLRGA